VGIKHVKVSTIADSASTVDVSPTDWNADHTITGPVILSSGTATNTPLKFVAGALATTSTAGGMEFDGTCFYNTAINATRQVAVTAQFMTINSNRTLTTSTSPQYLFNATTNGAVTVGAGTYHFDCMGCLTALSAAGRTIGWFLGGTATKTDGWIALARPLDTSTGNGVTAGAWSTGGSLTTTTTHATLSFYLNGRVVVTSSGTIVPQVQIATNNATAAVLLADSYFRIWPEGSSVFAFVGNWS
jgi:hypothetical protein